VTEDPSEDPDGFRFMVSGLRFPGYGLRFTVYGLQFIVQETVTLRRQRGEARGERGLTIILSYVRRSIAARSIVYMDSVDAV
jgi:hypothetical protein